MLDRRKKLAGYVGGVFFASVHGEVHFAHVFGGDRARELHECGLQAGDFTQ